MSEVFAAAMHANERATLVGETSSGKGVSQTPHRIRDEGKLWLVEPTFYYPDTEKSWHESSPLSRGLARPLVSCSGQIPPPTPLHTRFGVLRLAESLCA